MTNVIITATIFSVLVVLVGVYMVLRSKRGYGVNASGEGNKHEIRNDGLLNDPRVVRMSGGSEDIVAGFENKEPFPKRLLCEKCGRVVTKDEFLETGRCPGCGGGMLKAIRK